MEEKERDGGWTVREEMDGWREGGGSRMRAKRSKKQQNEGGRKGWRRK